MRDHNEPNKLSASTITLGVIYLYIIWSCHYLIFLKSIYKIYRKDILNNMYLDYKMILGGINNCIQTILRSTSLSIFTSLLKLIPQIIGITICGIMVIPFCIDISKMALQYLFPSKKYTYNHFYHSKQTVNSINNFFADGRTSNEVIPYQFSKNQAVIRYSVNNTSEHWLQNRGTTNSILRQHGSFSTNQNEHSTMAQSLTTSNVH